MEKIPVRSDSGKMRIVVRYEEQEETTSLADRTTKQYTGTGMMSYQFEGGGVVDRIDDDTFQDRYSKEIYCRIK
jgi:hypothetical protein